MVYALFISMILTAVAAAQPPVKTSTPPSAAVASMNAAAAAVDKFTSTEGRFSIALPTDSAKFEALEPNPKAPKATGGKYIWVSEEGVVTVDYTDDPDFVVKTEKDYADVAEGLKVGIKSFGGTILSEQVYKLGSYRGYGVKFEDPDKLRGITRMLIVNGRMYTIFGLGRAGVKGADAFITAALDSFELTAKKP